MGSVHACPDLSDMHAEEERPAGESRWRQRLSSPSQPAELSAWRIVFPSADAHMWYTAHFPSHQHLYLTDVLCSAAGCSVPLPQAGPEITHRSRLISAVQPSPTQGARALDGRLRKVVVGLARPDTRRSLSVMARDGVRARPFLRCLTASRGFSLLASALLTDFPCRRATWPGSYGTGDDGKSSRLGVIYLGRYSGKLSLQAGRDGMGWALSTRAEPGWEKNGTCPNGQGSKGYPEL